MEKFVLKQEIEKLIEEGMTDVAIINNLHPKLMAAESHREKSWITWRIKQELRFFHNYSNAPKKLLDEASIILRNLVNALVSQKKTLTKNVYEPLDELRVLLNVVD